MGLFRLGDYRLSGGDVSRWKVECDALDDGDWEALAYLASLRLPPFSAVVGVPTGGLAFAAALGRYVTDDSALEVKLPWLVADDVLTTGGSMAGLRDDVARTSWPHVIGVVAFARGPCPDWVTPLFVLTPEKPGGGRGGEGG